jgi:hypothetical protein
MPAKVKAQVADTIESCEHARANDWPYVCAVDLSDFLAAQEHGLVTTELRGRLDVEALTAMSHHQTRTRSRCPHPWRKGASLSEARSIRVQMAFLGYPWPRDEEERPP